MIPTKPFISLSGHGNYIPVSYDWDYSVMLPFYFFRHPSLAIPVVCYNKTTRRG